MSIAVDASSPVRWAGLQNTGVGVASASFTAPANAFLVCCVQQNTDVASTSETCTIADSGGLTWTKQVERTAAEATAEGASYIFTARTTSSVSRTVTVTITFGSGVTYRVSAKLYVLTGVDVDGTPVDTVGANNEGGSSTNNLTTSSVTPGANGVLVVSATEWNALGAATSSDLTLASGPDHAEYAGEIDVISGLKTCTSGVGVTANLDAAGTSAAQWKWCQITVREAAAGNSSSVSPSISPSASVSPSASLSPSSSVSPSIAGTVYVERTVFDYID